MKKQTDKSKFKVVQSQPKYPEPDQQADPIGHLFAIMYESIDALTELIYMMSDEEVHMEHETLDDFRVCFLHELAECYAEEEE